MSGEEWSGGERRRREDWRGYEGRGEEWSAELMRGEERGGEE